VQAPHEIVAAFEQFADTRIGQHDRLAVRARWRIRCRDFRLVTENGDAEFGGIGEIGVVHAASREKLAIRNLQISAVVLGRGFVRFVIVVRDVDISPSSEMAGKKKLPLREACFLDALG
jgi:hypothetical protein